MARSARRAGCVRRGAGWARRRGVSAGAQGRKRNQHAFGTRFVFGGGSDKLCRLDKSSLRSNFASSTAVSKKYFLRFEWASFRFDGLSLDSRSLLRFEGSNLDSARGPI